MKTGTYYLNNYGNRWINLTNGKKDKVKVLFPDGHEETRTVIYYESFGNFAVTAVKIKGKVKTYFQEQIFVQDEDDIDRLFTGIVIKGKV